MMLLRLGAFILLPLLFWNGAGLSAAPHLAVFTTAVLLWSTETLPLPVTGLLIPVLAVLYGIAGAASAFEPFGSPIIGLLAGSLIVVRAVQVHGLDQRISLGLLSLPIVRTSPNWLFIVLSLLASFLGMWMSNTATCALLLPICLAIIATVEEKTHHQAAHHSAFAHRLLLTIAFFPSIAGMTTPIGSLPNAIAFQYLQQAGIELSFLWWMGHALPIAVALGLLCFGLLAWRYPLRGFALPDTLLMSENPECKKSNSLSAQRKVVALIGLVVLLWLIPSIVPLLTIGGTTVSLSSMFPVSVPPIIGATLLFAIEDRGRPLLSWRDTLAIDWGILFLFGGGLCLGAILDLSGLPTLFAEGITRWTEANVLVFVFLIVGVSVVLSEFVSNTATAAMLLPIATAAAKTLGLATHTIDVSVATAIVALGCVMGAGLGYMLPVSTPPNALVYNTGKIPTRHLMLLGFLLDCCGAATITGGVGLWLFVYS